LILAIVVVGGVNGDFFSDKKRLRHPKTDSHNVTSPDFFARHVIAILRSFSFHMTKKPPLSHRRSLSAVATALSLFTLTGLSAAEEKKSPLYDDADVGLWKEFPYNADLLPQFLKRSSEKRMRINAPEVTTHEKWSARPEVRYNGLMMIETPEETLRAVTHAKLTAEIWGGHPGTANKRFTINGRSTYPFPEIGTAFKHCTHQHLNQFLKVEDLVPAWNALQFNCDTGTTFWGHAIVENASLWLRYRAPHAASAEAVFAGGAAPTATASAQTDSVTLGINLGALKAENLLAVEYQAFYEGYDENGDGQISDWHGFRKNNQPIGYLARVDKAPYTASWDTSMLRPQSGVRVRAKCYLKEPSQTVYITASTTPLALQHPPQTTVSVHGLDFEPTPFWSRDHKKITATMTLQPEVLQDIERATLHVTVWDGGVEKVEHPFTFNGHPVKINDKGDHDTLYTIATIDPTWLKPGANTFELMSDTIHHGLEIFRPGPVLYLRKKTK
jgi:hypothetical protein